MTPNNENCIRVKRKTGKPKLVVLCILVAASGIEVKTNTFLAIIDQIAHNFGIGLIADRLDFEYNPDHLFYNIHPSLMFTKFIIQRNGQKKRIGQDMIFSSFLVNATASALSVTQQLLDRIY